MTVPQIISIVNQKGGCGKTTTSMNALHWFGKKKTKETPSIILIDTDEQSSSSRTIEKLEMPYEQIFDATKLGQRLVKIRDEYDYVIVDGPAGASDINRTIIMGSDLVIMPSRQYIYDVESTLHTVAFLEHAQNICRKPPIGVVFLSDVIPKVAAFREAQQFFRSRSNQSFVFLEESIPHQEVIGRMGNQSASVFQIGGKDAEKMAKKYDILFTQALEAYQAKTEQI